MLLLVALLASVQGKLVAGYDSYASMLSTLRKQDKTVTRERKEIFAAGDALQTRVTQLEGALGVSAPTARRSLRQQVVEPKDEFGGREGAAKSLEDAAEHPEKFGTYGTMLGKLHKQALKNAKQLLALQNAGKVLKQQVSKLEALLASGPGAGAAAATAAVAAVPIKAWKCYGTIGDADASKATFSGGTVAADLLRQMNDAALCTGVTSIAVVPTAGQDLAVLGATLDIFLSEHFVWQITSEPYEGDDAPTPPFVFAATTRPGHAQVLKQAQAVQMPADCASQKMTLANDPWRFFGSLWGVWTHELEAAVADGKTMFAPMTSTGKDYKWLGVGNHWCPAAQQTNKWLCYFLPITKCQPPKVYAPKDTCRAAKEGVALKECVEGYFTYSKGTADTRTQLRRDWSGSGLYGSPPIPAVGGVKDMAGGGPNGKSVWMRTVFQMLLTRMNYRTRARLHHQIKDFLATQAKDWDPKEQCVTIHARRGDKLEGLKNLGAQDPRRWQKKGFTKSFGEYIEAGKKMLAQLPGSGKKNTVFILTDDPTWVEQNKKNHPDLKIFGIAGKGQPEGPGADKVRHAAAARAAPPNAARVQIACPSSPTPNASRPQLHRR